jgi:hypothetical protein
VKTVEGRETPDCSALSKFSNHGGWLSKADVEDRYQRLLQEIDMEKTTQTHGPKLAPAFRDPADGEVRSSI